MVNVQELPLIQISLLSQLIWIADLYEIERNFPSLRLLSIRQI